MRRLVLILYLFTFSLSCTSWKQNEGANQVKIWFEAGFVKCGEDYFTHYKNEYAEIYVSEYGNSTKDALFQFKNLSYRVDKMPMTDTEKLNGMEWKGVGVLTYTQFRYYDGQKWWPWEDIPIGFRGQLMESLNAITKRVNSPLFVYPEKSKGKWAGFPTYFSKPNCSDLPSLQ